jgi:hypothetical protein
MNARAMKPVRTWQIVAAAVFALATGLVPYSLLCRAGKMPLGLRDNPWPFELASTLATLVSILFVVSAYRRRQGRVGATLGGAIALLATGAFLLFVHVGSYELPPPSGDLGIGTVAPDFTLPDEAGHAVSLSSMRGHPTLLVFYRGFW